MQTNRSPSGIRLILLGSDDRRLRDWLNGHPHGYERAAVVLWRRFDRWTGPFGASARYAAVDVIPMTDEWIVDSSPVHVNFHKAKLQPLYYRCAIENLVLGFVHNHPSGPGWFSATDDKNEEQMVRRLGAINEPNSELVALLLHNDRWYARLRSGLMPETAVDARHVAVLSDRVEIHMRDQSHSTDDEILARQESAFGKPFTAKMGSLRFCVVGAGGTGSPTATLLARAGAGEIIIIDGDKLEATNLNRVRGATVADVGKNKAAVLAGFINRMGLRSRAHAVEGYLQEPEALDAMSTADVVFACTDNESSRDIVNLAIHYHAQVLIDSGLGGRIDNDENGPFLRMHNGRVNVLLPEYGRCLYCHGVITPDQVKYEEAVRRDPELKKLSADELWEQHYLRNSGGEQSPGVGPFTSATADFAVMSLFDLIKPFRRLPSDLLRDCLRLDFVGCSLYSNAPANKTDCAYCQARMFRLKDERGTRLGLPSLGRH